MDIFLEALVLKAEEGDVVIETDERIVTPVKIELELQVQGYQNIVMKGYKDKNKITGKVTYSDPLKDTKMYKCLGKQGQSIKVKLLDAKSMKVEYRGH